MVITAPHPAQHAAGLSAHAAPMASSSAALARVRL